MKNSLIILAALVIGSFFVMNEARAQQAPGNPAPGGSFEKRLAQRKAERKIALDEQDTKRIQATCVNAQSKIRSIQQSASGVLENRRKVYQRVDAKLWVIIGQLKIAERDTFALEKLKSKYLKDATTFQTTSSNYRQTLDDLAVINCQADAVGFKALLETARLYYKDLGIQSKSLRGQVVNDIKANLTQQSQQMQTGGGN
jgi:hypothetical protein